MRLGLIGFGNIATALLGLLAKGARSSTSRCWSGPAGPPTRASASTAN